MSNSEGDYILAQNEFSGEQQKALEEMETHDVMTVTKPKHMTIVKVPGGWLYMIGELTVATFVPEKKILTKHR